MSELKKILVALGITDYSQGIFQYGLNLAAAFDAELIAANIINVRDVEAVRSIASMGYDVDGEHYVEGVRKERKLFIDNIINNSNLGNFSREKIKIIVKVGNPIESLLKIIVKENADMIVMGPKGRTDLEHVLVGSVAAKLFRRSPVTVVSYKDEKLSRQLMKKIH
ncbi:Universal stress protein family protein [Desulfonema limicola]|uniref:Universal stress protein family protein n=1 Tax=Desulfonema limicola TaxID=45656 RepID=A0A975B6A4_9BACT|nr:universal stress protein [Desulfonema limicola]QTA79520.1 Universal stress protein family protein [Desulfonema limicola]